MTLDAKDGEGDSFYETVHQEYKIFAEYKMIQSENIGGVYVIPSYGSSHLWFGVIFVREGIYTDGIFRFNISLPKRFPHTLELPKITFQSKLIHPLINSDTNELDISEAFSEWNSQECHLWHILKFIQFIFLHTIAYGNDTVVNQEATELILANRTEFLEKVKEYVRISKIEIYNDPPSSLIDKHYITFEPFVQDVHGPILENMKKKGEGLSISPPTSSSSGLSWVNDNNFQKSTK